MVISNEKLAVISDVHGNRWALEAVLADIDRRGIKQIVNLGDCLYGPLKPGETADLLISRDIPTVSGNEDREIVETSRAGVVSETLDYSRRSILAEHARWLRSLKPTLVFGGDLFLCHGTPDNDSEYLLQEVTDQGAGPRPAERIEKLVAEVRQRVILCGHDHTPGAVTLPDGRLVVNPGSVGLQAYTDDTPLEHVIQTGSPDARYAIIQRVDDTWHPEIITVAYDWQAASSCAEKNGRKDWAEWLTTGRA